MTDAWPAICTLAALVLLLVFIIRFQLNAFVALLIVSLGLGLATGMTPVAVVDSIGRGVGDILRGVAVILALGAMLGKMLDAGGAAEVIARTLVNRFGVQNASFAVLVAAYLIGIPILFNVGFLLLIPIMAQLQRETRKSFLYYVLPLAFSLGITHSLIPPKPGIVGAVRALSGAESGRVMVETILFGTLMGIPMVLVGWFGPGRLWARRHFVEVPEILMAPSPPAAAGGKTAPSFALSVFLVVLPLILCMAGFGIQLLDDLGHLPTWMREPLLETQISSDWPPLLIHSPRDWFLFLGKPEMALMISAGLAFWLLGVRRGIGAKQLAKLAGDSLTEVGSILLLFAAAGGFMEMIRSSGAGKYIAEMVLGFGVSKVAIFYLVAALSRVALGSATAAILTASSILADTAKSLAEAHPGIETMLVLAVANGVTFMTQPADSGFWMVKEYCNLSVRDVIFRFNACRITMSLTGLGLLLAWEYFL